jgi:phosphate starvation-inducible PhoH-like protein
VPSQPTDNAGKTDTIESLNLFFKNNALLPALYGDCDSHLTHVEKKLGITATSRGNALALHGPTRSVRLGKTIFERLYQRLEHGGEIDIAEIDATLRMVEGIENGEVEENLVRDIRLQTIKKTITPYTPLQANYLRALLKHDLTFGIGPAGTGKTYLAVAVAVHMFINRKVERIILSRPAVEAGERLGFLPGDLKDKIDPYLRPLYDALFDMMPGDKVTKYIETGEIEVAPLAFMRGRTLSNAFVILDEAQNTTPMQMKMFLTRLGQGSRMVITGDLSQIDLPRDVKSGLRDALQKISHIEGIASIKFSDKDVVRHSLAARIVQAYDEWDRKDSRESTEKDQATSL